MFKTNGELFEVIPVNDPSAGPEIRSISNVYRRHDEFHEGILFEYTDGTWELTDTHGKHVTTVNSRDNALNALQGQLILDVLNGKIDGFEIGIR